MAYCYICDRALNDNEVSEEHIIPNALGGRLKSTKVLCETHNNELGKINDAAFVSIFEHITKLANIKTERKVSDELVGGYNPSVGIAVSIKEGVARPKRLTFDEKSMTLYVPNTKMAQNYRKKIEKDGLDWNKVTVVSSFDESDIVVFNGFDTEVFNKGLAKIATNFAVDRGIKRNDLDLVLDSGGFKSSIKIYPYSPDVREILKGGDSSTDNYPFHILALHSDCYNNLYCYVELFSKFKHIVLLSNNYHGNEVHEHYYYSVSKSKKLKSAQYFSSYPQLNRFVQAQEIDKYYKAHQIPDLEKELEQLLASGTLQKLYWLDSCISNKFIEEHLDDYYSIVHEN
ncbi:putative HNH endonuclease 5 domain-containing protein [Vibrio crassostreae]|nr:putative HNH endonuclease 5 domain-containing protein [Vibrio crassostreae]